MKKVKQKKNFRKMYWVLFIIAFGLFYAAADSVIQTVSYAGMDADVFEVKMVEDDNTSTQYYALFINGSEEGMVNFNEYGIIDTSGNTNPKASVIIHKIRQLFQYLLFYLVLWMMFNIVKSVNSSQNLFVKENVKYLRIAGWMTIAAGALPNILYLVLFSCFYRYIQIFGNNTAVHYFMIATGIIILVFAEIFKYGCELQDEVDLIA